MMRKDDEYEGASWQPFFVIKIVTTARLPHNLISMRHLSDGPPHPHFVAQNRRLIFHHRISTWE
jgi:hypothetical protein